MSIPEPVPAQPETVLNVTLTINSNREINVEQTVLANIHDSGQLSTLVTFVRVGEEEATIENQVALDANELWCVRQQPHNNRFMICCDICLDWFHGKCVGITKVQGEVMEEAGQNWKCPPCLAGLENNSASISESDDAGSWVSEDDPYRL